MKQTTLFQRVAKMALPLLGAFILTFSTASAQSSNDDKKKCCNTTSVCKKQCGEACQSKCKDNCQKDCKKKCDGKKKCDAAKKCDGKKKCDAAKKCDGKKKCDGAKMRRQRLRLRTFGRSNIRKGTSDDSRGLAINTKPASSSRLLSGLDSVFGIWPFALTWVAMVPFGSVLPLRSAPSGEPWLPCFGWLPSSN